MPRPRTNQNGIWCRNVHDTWSNPDGWRTDVRASVLHAPQVRGAAFLLDDLRAVVVPIDDLRRALFGIPRRKNGSVGPFNVSPHAGKINGVSIPMKIISLG